MKKINKIITFLVLVFIFSLFNIKQVFAEEVIVDNVAPFSDENKIVTSNLISDTKTLATIEPIIIADTNKALEQINPIITSPESNGKLDGGQIIKGEIKSGYNVKVYIDDAYRTTLSVWPSKTGASGFFYQPIQKLSLGKHNVRFVSTKNGIDYGSSDKVEFEVVEGYGTPDILTPYYYADDHSTYVIRGYGNTGDKIEVYIDDVKVRYIDSLYGKTSSTYFALAVKNLKEGTHKAYVLSYSKDLNKVSKSKLIYFDVALSSDEKTNTKVDGSKDDKTKIENNDKKKDEINKSSNNSTKVDVKKDTKKTNDSLPTQKEKQDKSILIGIVLLIVAILLIVFWLASENKEKIKKFIDNLFEEDDEGDKNK